MGIVRVLRRQRSVPFNYGLNIGDVYQGGFFDHAFEKKLPIKIAILHAMPARQNSHFFFPKW